VDRLYLFAQVSIVRAQPFELAFGSLQLLGQGVGGVVPRHIGGAVVVVVPSIGEGLAGAHLSFARALQEGVDRWGAARTDEPRRRWSGLTGAATHLE
jgi:hypothetical protein